MKNILIKVPSKADLNIGLGDMLITTGPICQKSNRNDDLYMLTPILLMVVAYAATEVREGTLLRYIDIFFLGSDASATKVLESKLDCEPSKRYITLSNKDSRKSLIVNSQHALEMIDSLSKHQPLRNDRSDNLCGMEMYTRIIRMEELHLVKSSYLFSLDAKQPDISKWPKLAIKRWMTSHLMLPTRITEKLENNLGERGVSPAEIVVEAVKASITARKAQATKYSKGKQGSVPGDFYMNVQKAARQPQINKEFIPLDNGLVEITLRDNSYALDIKEGAYFAPNTMQLNTLLSGREFSKLVETFYERYGLLLFDGYQVGTLHNSRSDAARYAELDSYMLDFRINSSYGDHTRLFLTVNRTERHFLIFLRTVARRTSIIRLDDDALRRADIFDAEEIDRCRGTYEVPEFIRAAREVEEGITGRRNARLNSAEIPEEGNLGLGYAATYSSPPNNTISPIQFTNACEGVVASTMYIDMHGTSKMRLYGAEDIVAPAVAMAVNPVNPHDMSMNTFGGIGRLSIGRLNEIDSLYFAPTVIRVYRDAVAIDIDSGRDLLDEIDGYINSSRCYIRLGSWSVLLRQDLSGQDDEELAGIHIDVYFKATLLNAVPEYHYRGSLSCTDAGIPFSIDGFVTYIGADAGEIAMVPQENQNRMEGMDNVEG